MYTLQWIIVVVTTMFPAVHQRGANLCENAYVTIRCYENTTLHIIYANYGRLSPTRCGSHNTTNCGAANSTAVIKNTCQSRVSCEIHASYLVFGDPCPYVPKYLLVTYECIPSGSYNTTAGSLVSSVSPSMATTVTSEYNSRTTANSHISSILSSTLTTGNQSAFTTGNQSAFTTGNQSAFVGTTNTVTDLATNLTKMGISYSFFQDETNVAVVSSVAGIVGLVILSSVVYLLLSQGNTPRLCCQSGATTVYPENKELEVCQERNSRI